MPARRATRPRNVVGMIVPAVEDEATQRALTAVTGTIEQMRSQPTYVLVEADLIVGVNAVPHGLGRVPKFAAVSHTVADATYDAAMTAATERQVTITVIGVAQKGAAVLLM